MVNFKPLLDKWMGFVGRMNDKGVPLPMVRDPKTGRGDVALTLVFLSSLWLQVGLVGKWSNYLNVDMGQALNWFYACCALYWARKLSNDGKKVTLDDSVQQPSLKQPQQPQQPHKDS